MTEACPAFWLDAPHILLTQASEFFPFTEHDKRCTASALNSFTRFGIYLGVLLALVRLDPTWLLVSIAFAAFAAGAWLMMSQSGAVREGFAKLNLNGISDVREGFGLYGEYDTEAPIVDAGAVNGTYVPDVIGRCGRTEPTSANPFMNVLISEISDNPHRSAAADVTGIKVRNELDSYFETMFASDPGDAFQHMQSQRQWYTMPSTTIPNDVDSLQNWRYRTPGQTCKEGNQEVCVFDTGDASYPWREMRRLT
jgi:hypothetical protein